MKNRDKKKSIYAICEYKFYIINNKYDFVRKSQICERIYQNVKEFR